MSNQPNPINITVTVDTDNITEANKNTTVVFSQGLGGPVEQPGHPENYTSEVEKNQKIIWTAVPKNSNTVVFFQNVKHEGGKPIMRSIKRGNGHNVYTAMVGNDNSINNNDEEKYSITIGLLGYEGMAGSNENGPIVYLGKTVAYMNSYQDNVWHIIAEAPFEIEGIAGYNTNGPIIFSGNRVAYMNGYASNQWVEIANAPFDIEGIAGENTKGVVVYNGNRVAYIDNYAGGRWVEVANAPFNIEGIAGDNTSGPMIYAGNQVYCMLGYDTGSNRWQALPEAPFNIEGMHGKYHNGPVIYSGSQVAYIGPETGGTWQSLDANAPFDIEGIAGNGTRGPIVFSGPQVKYMSFNNNNRAMWTDVANMPFNTRSFTIDPRIKMKAQTR